MFKGIANLASLMRNAGDLPAKMEELSKSLQDRTVVGAAGGELVLVEMNGLSQVTKVTIDPLLMERSDREMLENLLPAAINQASAKAKQLHLEAMQDLTGGLDLSGMEKMLERFSPGQDPTAPRS